MNAFREFKRVWMPLGWKLWFVLCLRMFCLLTGYWPIVGESIAICVCGGPTVLLVPEDEAELAGAGFADSIETFVPETLSETRRVLEAVKPRLAEFCDKLKIRRGSIGIESGVSSQAASYLAIHLFGDELSKMLRELLPDCEGVPIDEWIRTLSSIKTPTRTRKNPTGLWYCQECI